MTMRRGGGLLGLPAVIFELTKARITFAVTFSVAAGHFMFMEAITASVLLPALGVFLLACGSAALNEVQEARIDALMARTRGRPIPSGRISRDWALFIALALIGAAFYTLASIEAHTLTVLGLAGLALVWYNGVYVLLKRVTAFAVVPGALVGAIPPVIGWTAGGGLALDGAILKVAFFFFLWQIPHFWLLLLMHGRDYENAGLPSLTKLLAPQQIRRITFMWILAVCVTSVLMIVSGRIALPWNLGILLASLWLALSALDFLRGGRRDVDACFPLFMRINVYAFLVMVFLSGNAVW
jgi:protoheme IX farnesyltransferase